MKKVAVLIICLFASLVSSQITIINTGTTDNLVSISKINNNIFISGYSSYLAKSYNNCNTLIQINTPVFTEAPQNRYYRTFRVDTNVTFLSYNSGSNWKFYKSSNGGNSWVKKQDSTHANLSLVEPTLLFFDTLNGAIMFDFNRAIYTSNGVTTYTTGWWLNGAGWVSCGNGAGAVVLGDSIAIFGETWYGGSYMTKNRGKTWESAGAGGAVRDFEIINKDTIYYVSSPANINPNAYFGYTSDGGLNWTYKTITDPTYFLNICVKNKNEIYLLAREGASATGSAVILKTTNLGQTFTKITMPFIADLRDMKFLNDSIALICGDNGLLFKWNTKTALFVGVKENNNSKDNISIYPNPANEMLNIELQMINDYKDYKIEIINTLGQIVQTSNILNQTTKLNIEQLSKGIYTIQIESKTKIIDRSKFVKQ